MVGIASTRTPEHAAAATAARPTGTDGDTAATAAAAPTLVALGLLFVAAWSDGAFAVNSWAPLAVFAIVALAATRANGLRGPALAGVVAMWAFAAWSIASITWSDSPDRGVESATRTALYAALLSLPLLTLPSRRWALRTGRLLALAAAGVVALSFVGCLVHGADWFLAGRLNDPVGYRNGTAALFALCFWPLLCLSAQRRSHVLLRAGCFALAITAVALGYLTQSRGVLLGFCFGAVVALALGPDRIRRAWLTLLAVCGVGIVSDSLLDPYNVFLDTATTSEAAVTGAVHSVGLLAASGFGVALVLALLDGGLRVGDRGYRLLRQVAAGALVVLTLGAVAGGVAVAGNPVSLVADKAREFRQLDAAAPGESRLGATGGQRYDLWRIAWDEFASAPLIGVGEGGYPVRYYEERATDRNLSDPHSLPLRVLAETGAIGFLLLAAALAALALAIFRGWRRASVEERRWASALCAAGAALLAQSTVDWLWLIPGLTGLALMCLATAVAIVALPDASTRHGAGGARWAAPATIATRAVAAGAAVLVALLLMSDVYVRGARAEAIDSQTRLDRAKTAQRLNPFDLAPRFQQAGALEELRRRPAAREALRDALEVEPSSFVTMALLGDLETRAGNERAARVWYRRAFAINPRDVGLEQLAGR